MAIDKHNTWRPVSVATMRAKILGKGPSIVPNMAQGLFFVFLSASLHPQPAFAGSEVAEQPTSSNFLSEIATVAPPQTQAREAHRPKRADSALEPMSHEARYMADWVVDSGDNLGLPFTIVDKTDAKVFVFYADGRLRGAAPALLGLATGDDGVPGIGNRALSTIRPEERTTPAGRFVAALDRNLHGKEILWVDYAGAISMHPVLTTKIKERRLQRLATPTPHDNRISYGCINVPAKFFENVVRPAFSGTNGIVYVLPETKLSQEVFGSYDVDNYAQL